MPPKIVLLGIGAAAVLSGTVVLAVSQQWWWLAAAGAMTLVSLAFLVALDTHRRVRVLRSWLQREVRRELQRELRRLDKRVAQVGRGVEATRAAVAAAAEEPPAPQVTADTVGTVRLLQAQFVGRLDRMQAALDEAVAELTARDLPQGDRDDRDPAGP